MKIKTKHYIAFTVAGSFLTGLVVFLAEHICIASTNKHGLAMDHKSAWFNVYQNSISAIISAVAAFLTLLLIFIQMSEISKNEKNREIDTQDRLASRFEDRFFKLIELWKSERNNIAFYHQTVWQKGKEAYKPLWLKLKAKIFSDKFLLNPRCGTEEIAINNDQHRWVMVERVSPHITRLNAKVNDVIGNIALSEFAQNEGRCLDSTLKLIAHILSEIDAHCPANEKKKYINTLIH